MRDVRTAQRREEEWLAQNAPQQCIICKRWFIKRTGKICCSQGCLQKLEERTKQQKAKAS